MSPRFTSRSLTLAALMAGLTALSAFITISVFGPAPFTLQATDKGRPSLVNNVVTQNS